MLQLSQQSSAFRWVYACSSHCFNILISVSIPFGSQTWWSNPFETEEPSALTAHHLLTFWPSPVSPASQFSFCPHFLTQLPFLSAHPLKAVSRPSTAVAPTVFFLCFFKRSQQHLSVDLSQYWWNHSQWPCSPLLHLPPYLPPYSKLLQ